MPLVLSNKENMILVVWFLCFCFCFCFFFFQQFLDILLKDWSTHKMDQWIAKERLDITSTQGD